jgi:serine/threonine protein kinase
MKNCPTCQKTYPDDFGLCPRDGTALVESGAWTEGSVVRGKYRILAKLGQGGMGAVYKAVHLRFNEVRALKVMSPQVAGDPLFVKRFEHEAVITRKLQHPNAVRVDDIDETDDGRPFIVMEFIEGQSLKKLIQSEGPLPVPRVCSIIKQAAAALGASHELGMVHRDIKPDNIALVVTPAGEQAKVLDFGIAKLKEARAGDAAGGTLTGTGVVIGTPQYMSPEQATGKRGDELDGRSDLYSLGIVMYQMLSGELPFTAETTMGILVAHMQEPPRPILSVRPELHIPEAVAAVVMKCLEKKPQNRPANAAALIAEIERAEAQPSVPMAATRVMHSGEPLRVEAPVAPPEPPPTPFDRAPAAEPPERPRVQLSPRLATPSSATQASPPAPRTAVAPAAKIQTAGGSRLGLWAGAGAVAVLLGLTLWYFSSRPAPQIPAGSESNPTQQSPPVQQPTGQSGAPAAGATSTAEPPAQKPASQSDAPAASPGTGKSGTARPNGAAVDSSPPTSVARPIDAGELQKKISAAKTEGDLYFENGEYDNAISAYQNGLKADPTNAELLQKIQKARNAKATEVRIK